MHIEDLKIYFVYSFTCFIFSTLLIASAKMPTQLFSSTKQTCSDYNLALQLHEQIQNPNKLFTWVSRLEIKNEVDLVWNDETTKADIISAWGRKKYPHLLVDFNNGYEKYLEMYKTLPKEFRFVLLTPEGRNFGTFTSGINGFTNWGTIESHLHSKGYTVADLIAAFDDDRLVAWFAMQMPFIEHPKLISIPLGYMEWRGTLLIDEFFDFPVDGSAKKECNIGLTYSDRPGIRSNWTKYFNDTFGPLEFPKFKSFDFVNITRHCKYIPAPFGISPDTHRVWETLMSGGIPIVYTTPFDRTFHNLPVLLIDALTDVTPKFLEEKFYEITCKPYDFQRLTISWWIDVVLKSARDPSYLNKLHPISNPARRIYDSFEQNLKTWKWVSDI